MFLYIAILKRKQINDNPKNLKKTSKQNCLRYNNFYSLKYN